jgi:hypothetical protein
MINNHAERHERLREARRGPKSEKGARGERGPAGRDGARGKDGVTMTRLVGIKRWKIAAGDYSARAIMTDGSRSPKLDLRPLFVQHMNKTSER